MKLQSTSLEPSFAFTERQIERLIEQLEFKKKHKVQYDSLTNREKQIVLYMIEGYRVSQISERLFISKHTVEQHKKNIKRKLHIKSLPELLKYALAFDLV